MGKSLVKFHPNPPMVPWTPQQRQHAPSDSQDPQTEQRHPSPSPKKNWWLRATASVTAIALMLTAGFLWWPTDGIQFLAAQAEVAERHNACDDIRHLWEEHTSAQTHNMRDNVITFVSPVWCQYNFVLGQKFREKINGGAAVAEQSLHIRTESYNLQVTAQYCADESEYQTSSSPISRMCTGLWKIMRGKPESVVRTNAKTTRNGLPQIYMKDIEMILGKRIRIP